MKQPAKFSIDLPLLSCRGEGPAQQEAWNRLELTYNARAYVSAEERFRWRSKREEEKPGRPPPNLAVKHVGAVGELPRRDLCRGGGWTLDDIRQAVASSDKRIVFPQILRVVEETDSAQARPEPLPQLPLVVVAGAD